MITYEEYFNEENKFFRFPKRLFNDPVLNELSSDAKLLYMILLDRRCLSDSNRNEWTDENGCVFIYFTIKEIMSLIKRGNKKVNELLKELEDKYLIERRHRGLGKPNMIYVYDLLRLDNNNWRPGADYESLRKLCGYESPNYS